MTNEQTKYTMPYWMLGKTMRELLIDIMVNDTETPQKKISTIALNDYLHQCETDEHLKQFTWIYTNTKTDYLNHLDYSAIAVVNFINELLTKHPIPYEQYIYGSKDASYRKIATQLVRYIEIISDKELDKDIRMLTVNKMRGMLAYLAMDTHINDLTVIYRNTKPEVDINVGYNTSAVTKFVIEMRETYNNSEITPVETPTENLHIDNV